MFPLLHELPGVLVQKLFVALSIQWGCGWGKNLSSGVESKPIAYPKKRIKRDTIGFLNTVSTRLSYSQSPEHMLYTSDSQPFPPSFFFSVKSSLHFAFFTFSSYPYTNWCYFGSNYLFLSMMFQFVDLLLEVWCSNLKTTYQMWWNKCWLKKRNNYFLVSLGAIEYGSHNPPCFFFFFYLKIILSLFS